MTAFHYCHDCGKASYSSRKAAKNARMRLGRTGLGVYKCYYNDRYFHIGHLVTSDRTTERKLHDER